MVTLQDLIDVILLESGQFIADLDATLLDKKKLEIMIARELGLYSRYLPHTRTLEGRLYNGKTFTQEGDGFVPKAVVSIRTDKFNFIGYSITPIPASVHSYYWRYDKPVLYFRYPDGVYTYTYMVDHVYDKVTARIETINIEDRLINLLVGRFLMTVGKSRRAFTVSEIPIETDASEMISEGKEIYDETLEFIKLNSSFNLAILV